LKRACNNGDYFIDISQDQKIFLILRNRVMCKLPFLADQLCPRDTRLRRPLAAFARRLSDDRRPARCAGHVVGPLYGFYEQHQSIQDRAAGKTTALNEAFDTRIKNQELASLFLAQNQGVHGGS